MNRVLIALLIHLAVPVVLAAGPLLALLRRLAVALPRPAVRTLPPAGASGAAGDETQLHTLRRPLDTYLGRGVKEGSAGPS